MNPTYTGRWLAWAFVMSIAIGGILALLTAEWGVFPR